MLDAVVAEHDAHWHLARVDFSGGSLWVRDSGIPLGQRVRVTGSSIINTLPASVSALGDDAPLLARLTRRSAAALALVRGQQVWVKIKAVALIA